jgi:hypothetical protein
MRRLLQLICVLCVTAGLSSTASAQAYQNGPPPQHRLVLRDTTVFRLNPLGLITDARLTYRFRLFESQKVAFRDNFIGIGLAPAVSGAFARVGAYVEVQPTSFLQLWANYEAVSYFGASDFFQSFPDAMSDYSDTVIKARGELEKTDPLKNYSTTGSQFNVGGTLQFRVDLPSLGGGIIARDLFRASQGHYKLRAGDRVYYDIVSDVLTENHGWYVVNDVDFGFQKAMNARGASLVAGVRWTLTAPFYSEKAFADGNIQTTGNGPTHRVGPLFAYTFYQEDGRRFNAPTVLLLLNWWVKHEYRTGLDVSSAMPYFILGFSFSGDFLGQ